MQVNKKIEEVAISAARKTGKILLKDFNNFERSKVELKSLREIITQSDLKSEKLIIKEIKKNFPDHRILSEEAGDNDKKSDYFWIVDPIDGTTNFSIHNPLWAISIGVAYKNEIIFGVVFAPFLDELFIARKKGGAYKDGKKIKVSNVKTGKVINTYCHGSNKEDAKKAMMYYGRQKLNNLDCRQLGSASVELAYVAAGRVESIVIPGANSWDVAAGVLLVREAGGRVTDFENKKWTLKSHDIIASNGKVHKDILDVLK